MMRMDRPFLGVVFPLGLLFLLLCIPQRIEAASLMWGGAPGGPSPVSISEGGTYTISLNESAPISLVVADELGPLFGKLYRIDASTTEPTREFLIEVFQHDPEVPDTQFAWPAASSYELDVHGPPAPPPDVGYIDMLKKWFAKTLSVPVAHAQELPPPVFPVVETIHFTIEDASEATSDPVIIIPGILGSEQQNGIWVIDPILHTYDDLIATLDANGYTRELDLFTFPYNWRKSNVETALLLKEKIDAVKDICSCDKVDLVAHSMGGLVARQYIQSDAYENDIDQLIFLGTPHLGAPKAYLMWEGGEIGPLSIRPSFFFDNLAEKILSLEAHELGYDDLFSYVRGEPIASVQQLLPVYDYIRDEGISRLYPDSYPKNEFLDELNETLSELIDSGAEIYNFIGDFGMTTIGGIDAVDRPSTLPKWEHGYPRLFDAPLGNHGLILVDGDGTVPITSASHVGVNLEIFPFEHGKLVTGSQARVFEALTGREASVLVTDKPGAIVSVLRFFMLSPADFLVIAPDGKKVGKNLNSQEINEIPDAFYTGFNTDTEFITILNPLEGEYKIYAQGVGEGSYTIKTDFISSATTTGAAFTGVTGPGITSELKLMLQEEGIANSSLESVVTYESTFADLEKIYALKWINIGVYTSLKVQLAVAKKAPPVVAKRLLQAMLKLLKQYRGKLVKEQGYQILKTDIEELLSQ